MRRFFSNQVTGGRWVTLGLVSALLAARPALAAEFDVTLELPSLNVAEYHKPYVAVWLEPAKGGAAVQLAVWYEDKKANGKGQEWLKDLRQWWRKVGRASSMPIDGVSGATRLAGTHSLRFTAGKPPIGELAAGEYILFVEAAREVGGREVVKLPFSWPVAEVQTLKQQGSSELGAISLSLTP